VQDEKPEFYTTVVSGARLDGSRDRPSKEPGGQECEKCGCIFIGEEWHDLCSVCTVIELRENGIG